MPCRPATTTPSDALPIELTNSDSGTSSDSDSPAPSEARPGSYPDDDTNTEAGDWISSYLSENELQSKRVSDTERDSDGDSRSEIDRDMDRESDEYRAPQPTAKEPAKEEEEEEEEEDQSNLNFDELDSEANVMYSDTDNQLKAATFSKLVYKLTSSTTEIGTISP